MPEIWCRCSVTQVKMKSKKKKFQMNRLLKNNSKLIQILQIFYDIEFIFLIVFSVYLCYTTSTSIFGHDIFIIFQRLQKSLARISFLNFICFFSKDLLRFLMKLLVHRSFQWFPALIQLHFHRTNDTVLLNLHSFCIVFLYSKC